MNERCVRSVDHPEIYPSVTKQNGKILVGNAEGRSHDQGAEQKHRQQRLTLEQQYAFLPAHVLSHRRIRERKRESREE